MKISGTHSDDPWDYAGAAKAHVGHKLSEPAIVYYVYFYRAHPEILSNDHTGEKSTKAVRGGSTDDLNFEEEQSVRKGKNNKKKAADESIALAITESAQLQESQFKQRNDILEASLRVQENELLSEQFYKSVDVTKDSLVPPKLRRICEINAMQIAKNLKMYSDESQLEENKNAQANTNDPPAMEI